MAENDSTNAGWSLYEGGSGRRIVCRDGEQGFTHGDPAWYRVGLVEVHGDPPVALSTATIPPDIANLILGLNEERDHRLIALAFALERYLAEDCNAGGEPPDNAPLVAWGLSESLKDALDSVRHERSLRAFPGMGRQVAAVEEAA